MSDLNAPMLKRLCDALEGGTHRERVQALTYLLDALHVAGDIHRRECEMELAALRAQVARTEELEALVAELQARISGLLGAERGGDPLHRSEVHGLNHKLNIARQRVSQLEAFIQSSAPSAWSANLSPDAAAWGEEAERRFGIVVADRMTEHEGAAR